MEVDDTRFKIFRTLVTARKEMTLADISKRMKIPKQKIQYHLPFLEESGLVVKTESGGFFVQPVFVDEEVRKFCESKIEEIIKRLMDTEIYMEVTEEEEKEIIIKNCLRTLVILTLDEL